MIVSAPVEVLVGAGGAPTTNWSTRLNERLIET